MKGKTMKLTHNQASQVLSFSQRNLKNIDVKEFGILNLLSFNKFIQECRNLNELAVKTHNMFAEEQVFKLIEKHPAKKQFIQELFKKNIFIDIVGTEQYINDNAELSTIKNEIIEIINLLGANIEEIGNSECEIEFVTNKEKLSNAIEKANIAIPEVLLIDFLLV